MVAVGLQWNCSGCRALPNHSAGLLITYRACSVSGVSSGPWCDSQRTRIFVLHSLSVSLSLSRALSLSLCLRRSNAGAVAIGTFVAFLGIRPLHLELCARRLALRQATELHFRVLVLPSCRGWFLHKIAHQNELGLNHHASRPQGSEAEDYCAARAAGAPP